MATYHRPRYRSDFEIAVICALSVESNAIEALFDEIWEDKDYNYSKAPGDLNTYTIGRIGRHNAVLAFMPGMGRSAAAGVAASFRSSFPGIKLGLVVGICGGVPVGDDEDNVGIVLGDVVISTGIVQYDFGRQFSDKAVRKDTLLDNLGRPNNEIRAFLAKLSGLQGCKRLKAEATAYLAALCSQEGFEKSKYPGATEDRLFRAEYRHKHQDPNDCNICAKCKTKDDKVCDEALESTCLELGCSNEQIVARERGSNPSVHFGLIASGDMVMKSGYHRDQIAKKENVIAFEMEGAGVWDSFPTIIIKSICDYADSHKSKKWQRYAAACGAAFMKAVLGEWRPTDIPVLSAESETRGPFYMIPRLEVPQFFGREAVLQDIEERIRAGPRNEYEPLVLVLQAMGGQGKTQLALRVCQLGKKVCQGIFWVDASSKATAERGFEQIAGLLNTTGRYLDDSVARIRFVNETLESWEERWLLVLDNYDEPHNFKDIKDFMPLSSKGVIVVTSRHESSVRRGQYIPVPSMLVDGGRNLLLSQYWNKSVDADEDDQVERVLQRLGGLALAIDQAAAYINYSKMLLSTFLAEYEKKKDTILKHTHELQWEYHSDKGDALGALTTWELSFEQIEPDDRNRKQHLTDFLGVCAYLEPTHISEDVFRIYHAETDAAFPWLELFLCDRVTDSTSLSKDDSQHGDEVEEYRSKRRAWDKSRFWSIISKLYRFSLLQNISSETTQSSSFFSIHPVIRDWLQIRKQGDLQNREYLRQSCKLLGTITQRDYRKKPLSLTLNRQLVAHIDAVLEICGSSSLHQVQLCQLTPSETFTFAKFFFDQWFFEKSQCLLKRLLCEDEKQFALKDIYRARAMALLSHMLCIRETYYEAESLAVQAVQALKQILGENDAETLCSMGHLAWIHHRLNHVQEAQELGLHVLGLCERLEEDHPTKIATLHDIGEMYNEQKRHVEAETLYLRFLEPKIQLKGENHRNTWATLLNVDLSYRSQERYDDAERFNLQALKLEMRALGESHPEILPTLCRLGNTWMLQNRFTEAEELFTQVLEIRTRVLGEGHPDTLGTMNELVGIYHYQERFVEAERLCDKALEGSMRALGGGHPNTLLSMMFKLFITIKDTS